MLILDEKHIDRHLCDPISIYCSTWLASAPCNANLGREPLRKRHSPRGMYCTARSQFSSAATLSPTNRLKIYMALHGFTLDIPFEAWFLHVFTDLPADFAPCKPMLTQAPSFRRAAPSVDMASRLSPSSARARWQSSAASR